MCRGGKRKELNLNVWKSNMFTHSFLSSIHRWLPDQRVITELHLVGIYHVPAVWEKDTCSSVVHIISCDTQKNFKEELGSKLRPQLLETQTFIYFTLGKIN